MIFSKTIGISKPGNPGKPAITYLSGAEWCDMSFTEFEQIVMETRAFLTKFGVHKHDRILIVAENHAKWLPIFLAIASYGAIAVPVDGQIPKTRFLNIVNDSKPRLVIVSKQFEEKTALFFNDVPGPCALVNFYFDLLHSKGEMAPAQAPPVTPQPNDPALIIYTSGTTGAPKGITHSHHSIMSAVEHCTRYGTVGSEDTMMSVIPYTHVFGFISSGLFPYYLGIRNVIAPTFNPLELVGIIANYNVTYSCIVPRLAEVLLQVISQTGKKFPKLQLGIGGSNCKGDVIGGLRKAGISVGFGYGMTETNGGICACFEGPLASVGKVPEPVKVKIDNPNGEGIGEILISSPTNTIGIYGRPELNKSLWAGEYLKTGDIGRIDENGYLFIMGRSKDVIIPAGGMNVYPDELEDRIGNLPFLKEMCVVGVNDSGSEFPALVFRINEDFFSKNNIRDYKFYIQEKIDAICATWPEWERIRMIIELAEPLPRSHSFKVQRNSVKELIKCKTDYERAGKKEGEGAVDERDIQKIFERVRPMVSKHLNIPEEELSIYKPLSRFNRLDSLGKISLLAYFQHSLKIQVGEFGEADFNSFYSFIRMMLRTNSAESLMAVNLAEKIDEMPIPVPLDYSLEGVNRRIKFLEDKTGANLSELKKFEYADTEKYQGNIENFFGFCSVPLGLVGPLRVKGEYARGEFFVPMATTEGALVASVSRGAQVATLSGGVETKIVADSISRVPIFLFETVGEMYKFVEWTKSNFDMIKAEAESTTRHGKLLSIDPYPMGSKAGLRFSYSCGDASGQNMTTIATHKAMHFIKGKYTGKMIDCFLECNMSGDKKVNAINFTSNRGKKVIAQVLIPHEIVSGYLKTTPERLCKVYDMGALGVLQAHAFGVQAHFSNPLTAVYIACGQDPACAAESACGVTHVEMMKDKINFTVTLPNIMVGTVGGGTGLPTQKACLEIIGCHGSGGARKMAEILAATVLAAEISLIASIASDDFAGAHASYGRHKPAAN